MEAKIFISHIAEEGELAHLLKQAIEADFGTQCRVFASTDLDSIQTGRNWLAAIEAALSSCKLLLVLCSAESVTRPWVNFELGAAWIKKIAIVPVCHSGLTMAALPMPLLQLEGIEVSEPGGLERLDATLARCFKPPRKGLGALVARREQIARFETGYLRSTANPEVQQFEHHIDLLLAPGPLSGETIPPGTIVKSDEKSMRLFDFSSAADRTWAEIEAAARRLHPDTRWLRQVQQRVCLASSERVFAPIQAIYHHSSGSFQPDLARVDTLADGSRRVHIHFVNTVVPPLADVPNEIGVLATMLRLGLRFRYEVIEKFSGRLDLARSLEDGKGGNLLDAARGAIETIEIDASSRGSEDLTRESAIELFKCPVERAEITDILDRWDEARACLFDPERRHTLEEARLHMRGMRDLNFRFMRLGTQRLHELVSSSWAEGAM